jgi:hypothetical protein
MIPSLIVVFSLFGSVCSVGLTGALLPYAVGTLLGAAFLGIIPHALVGIPVTSVLPTVLFGIILFYVLDKFALWRHCHAPDCDVHNPSALMTSCRERRSNRPPMCGQETKTYRNCADRKGGVDGRSDQNWLCPAHRRACW